MREFGWTRLVLQDGTVIERPAPSPLEQATFSRGPSDYSRSVDDDVDEVAADEADEKNLRAEWRDYWGRMTLSSGAPIPEFPGAEKAARFLAGRG